MINWWLTSFEILLSLFYSASGVSECVCVYRGNKWTMVQSQSVFDLYQPGLLPAGSFKLMSLLISSYFRKLDVYFTVWIIPLMLCISLGLFVSIQASLCFPILAAGYEKHLLHFKINVSFCYTTFTQTLPNQNGHVTAYGPLLWPKPCKNNDKHEK